MINKAFIFGFPIVALALFLGSALISCIRVNREVGAFPSAEYRICLESRTNGKGVADLKAYVSDEEKRNAFNYPVVNYQPGKLLAMNESDQIILQHINLGAEFGSAQRTLFLYFLL